MDTEEMIATLREASRTIRSADRVANDMACLLKGRLRHVNGNHLENLKRELRDFNMQTYKWKD